MQRGLERPLPGWGAGPYMVTRLQVCTGASINPYPIHLLRSHRRTVLLLCLFWLLYPRKTLNMGVNKLTYLLEKCLPTVVYCQCWHEKTGTSISYQNLPPLLLTWHWQYNQMRGSFLVTLRCCDCIAEELCILSVVWVYITAATMFAVGVVGNRGEYMERNATNALCFFAYLPFQFLPEKQMIWFENSLFLIFCTVSNMLFFTIEFMKFYNKRGHQGKSALKLTLDLM